MTLKLPTSWGPATVLTVLFALLAGVGGLVQLARGEMTFEEFIGSMKYAATALGLLAVGRGVAYGGPGTGTK